MDVLARIDEGMQARIGRTRFMGEELEIGPNWVHAVWGHAGESGKAGTYTDLGWAKNLKTTTGLTWLRGGMGGVLPLGTQTISTTPTATTYPTGGTPYTSNQLTGMRIICPITNIGTSPVYGNIGQNTTATITVDKWWTQTGTTGTTPAASTMGIIVPGLTTTSFMGLSDVGCTPAIGNTTIASSGGTEYIADGLERALCLYADASATTYTEYKLFTQTNASARNVKTGALFTCMGPPATCAGTMIAITDLNAQANLAQNDTLAVTWTWTVPAAG
jgi:hypothetical protein